MEFDEALQDIFYIPRILGTFPFDNQFRISAKSLAYCCLLRLLSAFGVIFAFMNRYSINKGVKEPVDFSLRFIGVMSVLGDNFFTLWWFLKRHRVSFLLESINEIQRKQNIALKRTHIRFAHYLLCLMSVTYILANTVFVSEENAVVEITNEIAYFLSASATVCFVGQFWDILHLLGYLFRESTQLCDENSVINYEIFLALCQAINEIYGSQVLYTITKSFVEIIVYLYMLLLPIFPGFNFSNILIMSLATNRIIGIISIILACEYYIQQEQNFNEDLRRRMIEGKSRVLLRNEKLKFHFVVGKETTFTACGFFNVGMSLICSMISAATTYLVVVLQYSSDNHQDTIHHPISNSKTSSP